MFGRFRKDKRIGELAAETSAELATLSDVDKAAMRDALAGGSKARQRVGLVLSLRQRQPAPRAADEVATVPRTEDDTMIVSSPASWYLYQRTAAFICEPGRAFRPVRYIAYTLDGQLQREIPRIIAVRDDVPFDSAEQRRLMWSGTELDLRLADVVAAARRLGLAGERHQVYLLTAPGQAGHVSLPAEVMERAARRHLRLVGRSGRSPAARLGTTLGLGRAG